MSGLKGIVDPNGNVYHFDHEYLESNPTIPAVDSTLTQEGAAADAAIVGEEISNLKEDLTQLSNEEYLIASVKWEDGKVKVTTGEEVDGQGGKRTEDYLKESDFISVNAGEAELYITRFTESNGTYTYYTGLQLTGSNNPYVFDANSEMYFRLSCNTPSKLSSITITSRAKLVDDVKKLLVDNTQLLSDVSGLKNSVYMQKILDIYEPNTFSNSYINWSDGTTISNTDARSSDFIAVATGQIVSYSLYAIGGTAVIASYDASKQYIQSASIKGTGNGSWQQNAGEFTVPNDVAYIKFASYKTKLDTDSITVKDNVSVSDYVKSNLYPWAGKKWAAFGTSITNTSYQDTHFLQPTGKYVPYLEEMSGMSVVNYGIAGGSILDNIMNKVLETDLSSYDVVTVEGSVNDHATSKPIGEVGDTTDETFAGAIYTIANYVYTHSDATLFFITDYVGRYVHINPAPDGSDFYGDCSPNKTNALDLLQIDYINMMIKQCEYFSIPCIKAGQECGINLMTGDLYLMDHIHSSYAGGKQYAQTIWENLKIKDPRVITV